MTSGASGAPALERSSPGDVQSGLFITIPGVEGQINVGVGPHNIPRHEISESYGTSRDFTADMCQHSTEINGYARSGLTRFINSLTSNPVKSSKNMLDALEEPIN